MLKRIRPLRLLTTTFLGAVLLLAPLPRASATPVEYSVLLAIIIVTCLPLVNEADLPPGSNIVVNQLATAAEGAQAANIVGNRAAELSRLAKAIGAAEALMGMTSDCDECGDLRDALQQVIGQAALLKTSAVGASGTCHPNGILQPNEQCDPLAIPSGCPVNATAVTYCSDECTCQIAIVP